MVILAFLAVVLTAMAVVSSERWTMLDGPEVAKHGRNGNVDGLRGFLALAVLTHHSLMYVRMAWTGRWDYFDPVATWMGQGGVALFFMITGYLFWGRLLRRKSPIDWTRLYIGRVFRIGPVYLLVAAATLPLAFACGTLNVTWLNLVSDMAQWFSLGLFSPPTVNKVYSPAFGVTWTLHYEWLFYFALPALAVCARTSAGRLFTPLILLAAGCLAASWLESGGRHPIAGSVHHEFVYVALFGAGMLTASLAERGWRLRGSDTMRSAIAAAALGGNVISSDGAYAAGPVLALAVVFYLVATGASLFGLLRTRAAQRLGQLSYGIYLVHSLILLVTFNAVAGWVIHHPALELVAYAAAAAITVLVAAAIHRTVEQPGIVAGERCLALLRTWVASAQAVSTVRPTR